MKLNCYLCWYKSNFDSKTEYVYIFAYTAKQAMYYFNNAFALMADSCESADLYKTEDDFILKHKAGEIWGANTAII